MKDAAFAKKLIDTANAYFNGDEGDYHCGICFATRDFPNRYSYDVMHQIMDELGERDQQDNRSYGPYSRLRDNWEPRAWMCLFLAAWLTEDDLTYEEPMEASPVKTTLFETVVDQRYENEDGSLVMERNDDNLNKWELKNADTGAVIGEPSWYRAKVAQDNKLVLVDLTN